MMNTSAEPFTCQGTRITSLRQLNLLPQADKERIYQTLAPLSLVSTYQLDLKQPGILDINALPGSSLATLALYHQVGAGDPLLYCQIADTSNNQIEVLFFVINDPHAPRFAVDHNWLDRLPKCEIGQRNEQAEVQAMQAGLAPGQIRAGLRMTRKLLDIFEQFVACLSHDMFLLTPLAYHNAILFERYGCNYIVGRRVMEQIHQAFAAPQGALRQQMDGSTPFRQPGMEKTVRGRSWAIYDGILGQPFDGVRQYKRVGKAASVCTFPDAVW